MTKPKRVSGDLSFASEENVALFWAKVSKTPDGCWLWTGSLNHGYGYAWTGKAKRRAHRLSLALHGVEIPPDLVVDHICRVRACVNPKHLRLVTNRDNLMCGEGLTAVHATKTHCIRGHEFTPANTRLTPQGWRDCRQCRREHQKGYRPKWLATQTKWKS